MSLFEKGHSTRCDYCGDDLSTGERLDAHDGKHRFDVQTLKVGHIHSKKFKPHKAACKCKTCKWVREVLAAQKKAYWDSLTAPKAA
jgi:hypothetical protein